MPDLQAPCSAILHQENRQPWPSMLHISSGVAFGVEASVHSTLNWTLLIRSFSRREKTL